MADTQAFKVKPQHTVLSQEKKVQTTRSKSGERAADISHVMNVPSTTVCSIMKNATHLKKKA